MRKTSHRLAAIVAGALLTAQALGATALASPTDAAPSLFGNEVFQNACTRDRQEEARAQAENREVEQVNEVRQEWRAAFTTFNRNGPTEQRWCWFGSQFGGGDGSDK